MHIKPTMKKINLTLNKGNFRLMKVMWGLDLILDLKNVINEIVLINGVNKFQKIYQIEFRIL